MPPFLLIPHRPRRRLRNGSDLRRHPPDDRAISEDAGGEKVHIIGLSILPGSQVPLIREVMQRLHAAGLGNIPIVLGGIIPAEDVFVLKQLGLAAVYTLKDFDRNRIMEIW